MENRKYKLKRKLLTFWVKLCHFVRPGREDYQGGKNKKTKKQTEVSTQNWHSWVRGWKLLANVSPPWHRGADPGSRYGAWRCERGDDREAAMGAGEWRGCQVQWSAGSGGEGGCHILLTWPRRMRQSAGPRPGQVPQSLPRSRPQRLGPRLAPRSAQTRPDGRTAGRLDGQRLAGKVWSLQLMKRVSSVFTWDTKPHHTLQPRALKCSFSTIFTGLFPEEDFLLATFSPQMHAFKYYFIFETSFVTL